jgi:uncharacterized protein (TIGR03067 family)
MKTHALLIMVLASFMVGAGLLAAGDEETIKKDRKIMTGTWRPISYQKDGKKFPEEQLQKTRTTFDATGKVTVQLEGKIIIQGQITIEPSKKPKQSDGTFTEGELKGKTLGIYELDGDRMKICYALPGKDRPTEFSSKPGSGHVLVVYERVKP